MMTSEEWSPERKAAFKEKLEYWRKNGCPQLIRDEASQPIKSMADGKIYDSKSEYRKKLREKGYIEVGDQKPTAPKVDLGSDDDRVKDIKKAMNIL